MKVFLLRTTVKKIILEKKMFSNLILYIKVVCTNRIAVMNATPPMLLKASTFRRILHTKSENVQLIDLHVFLTKPYGRFGEIRKRNHLSKAPDIEFALHHYVPAASVTYPVDNCGTGWD